MCEQTNSPVQNTDRPLWREGALDRPGDEIFVTAGGAIGINCGGTVIVMSLRKWHGLASSPPHQKKSPEGE